MICVIVEEGLHNKYDTKKFETIFTPGVRLIVIDASLYIFVLSCLTYVCALHL